MNPGPPPPTSLDPVDSFPLIYVLYTEPLMWTLTKDSHDLVPLSCVSTFYLSNNFTIIRKTLSPKLSDSSWGLDHDYSRGPSKNLRTTGVIHFFLVSTVPSTISFLGFLYLFPLTTLPMWCIQTFEGDGINTMEDVLLFPVVVGTLCFTTDRRMGRTQALLPPLRWCLDPRDVRYVKTNRHEFVVFVPSTWMTLIVIPVSVWFPPDWKSFDTLSINRPRPSWQRVLPRSLLTPTTSHIGDHTET